MRVLRRRRYILYAIFAAALLFLLAACAPEVVTIAVTAPPETVVVTATPAPPSPTPIPSASKALTVCVVGDPDTLYLYGGSQLAATRHAMEMLYDGPIDHVDYGYQPVILQKLPRIADGDADTRLVAAREGDRVLGAEGQVVELTEGVRVRPTGCYTTGCEVEFEEGMVWMDRLEVTFALREGVTWSDGEPLTAEDSVFAFEVASDSATPGYRDLVARTLSYRALDERQVKWVGLPGFIDETYFLNFFPPLPRHQLKGRWPAGLVGAMETRRRPLGWGPFVVDEWVQGDHITFSRNPNYFRADEGLPYLDQVALRFTAGASEMLADLVAGKCDVATHEAGLEPFTSLLVQAEASGLVQVASAPGTGWEHLDFGLDPASDGGRADFFGDVRVRQAVAQCIDRQAIVNEVTYGRSVAPDSYLSPNHPLYPEGDLTQWGYDPEAGRALLEEVGWVDEDDDGVREARRVEGVRSDTPFEVTLLAPSDDAVSSHTARIVRAYLADCGIRVNVDERPTWELLADGPEGPLFGRRFDMALTTLWLNRSVPLCERYLTSEIPQEERWDGVNVTGYSDPDYDAACQAARETLPGTMAYRTNHRRAQLIFSEDLPSLPLFMRLRVAAADPRVLNFSMDATSPSELWNAEMLDVQKIP